MKLLITICSMFLTTSATAASYNQCTVTFPSGTLSGICVKEPTNKYIEFFTCNGEFQAFIAPGAIPIHYTATCGPKHFGFPGDKDKDKELDRN